MNENEFNLDFDFEKEYGFDLPKEEAEPQIDDTFDLDAILADDFGMESDQYDGEYAADFDYGPEPELEMAEEADVPADENADFQMDEQMPAMEIEEPAEEEEYPEKPPVLESVKAFASGIIGKVTASAKGAFSERRTRAPEEPSVSEQPQSEAPREGRRRKPMSPMRRFKNEQLPLIILGVTAVLILIFVFGSVSRGIAKAKLNKEAEDKAAASAQSAAEKEAREVEALLEEAQVLAASYDYDGAKALLDTFSGSTSKYPAIDQAKADYEMAKAQMVAYDDVGSITNLSFHLLIADPQRAFANADYGTSYQKNFVTIDEFQSILQDLYNNNYILVDMDDLVTETTADGVTTYKLATLMLPKDKTPIMITETLVNYFTYMVDSDGDGAADKGGAGFASRLVVDEKGDIKAEMVDADGNTVTGNYDLVPILEAFIEEHPDFSYRGARATLAITGYDGIFGYRTNAEIASTKGQEYLDQQTAGAKEVVDALRSKGYTIACNSYRNKNYGDSSADAIQADLNSWNKEVDSIIGDVDTLVFAQGGDISTTGDYTGSKYTVLYNEGFRYFIGAGAKASTEVTAEYVRQVRLMVTGTQMVNASSVYADFFDAKSLLDTARGAAGTDASSTT